LSQQTTSRRLADRKTAKFQKNITKRGSVPETTIKKGNDYPLGPVVLGFFIFVVNGSVCLLTFSKSFFLFYWSMLVAYYFRMHFFCVLFSFENIDTIHPSV
jgi:hypothetical protein